MSDANDTYFVIRVSEDGDISVRAWDKANLLTKVLGEEPYYGTRECFPAIPDQDPQSWPEGILVIKGKIVTPKAVQKIVEYEVE